MIALFLMAASAAAAPQASPRPAAPAPVAPAATPANISARSAVEAQLRSPPRQDERRSLGAEEAEIIYKRYLASIGQRIERAADERSRPAQ